MKRTNRNKNGIITCGYLPIFEKENGFDYLKEYDQVAVIDSDIYIREDAPNVFDELPDDFLFGAVLERDLPINGSHKKKAIGYSRDMFSKLNDVDWNWNKDKIAEYANMGMMVMNQGILEYLNGQTPREFILRPEFKDFVDGIGLYKYSTDQVLLNYWLKKEKIPTKFLDWKWNTLYRAVDDKHLKDGHFIHFFLKNQISKKGEDIGEIKRVLNK